MIIMWTVRQDGIPTRTEYPGTPAWRHVANLNVACRLAEGHRAWIELLGTP
jgi:hypothetical protein